jgi:serine/threonine protein phosphatase PrpC
MPFWKRRSKKESQPRVQRKGISFGTARDIGRVRTTNQDQVFAMQTALPGPGKQLSLGLFIVADGMGGHTGGEIASKRAVEIVAVEVLGGLLLPVLKEEPPEAIQNMLQDAIITANHRIIEEAQLQGSDMGTTITAALLLDDQIYVAHIGDTRLYTYGEEGLQCRTRDHSMVARLLELGQITAEEARDHPKRNYLYQSVGQHSDIEIEIFSFSLEGCSHLLLCSDGLWGVAGEKTMQKAFLQDRDAQHTCDWLVEQANAAGGDDNISVVVVAFPGPQLDPAV